MFKLSTAAKEELVKRRETQKDKVFSLHLRYSCFVSIRVSMIDYHDEDYILVEGIPFVIPKEEYHYFEKKKLDYAPDNTGFKRFEII